MKKTLFDGPADRGEIVLEWLTKVTVILVVLGIVGFDAISVATLRLRLQDAANSAAFAAVDAADGRRDVRAATNAAEQRIEQEYSSFDLIPESIRVGTDGSVQLAVQGTASTIVLRHIGPLKQYTIETRTGSASPVR